MVKRHTVKNTIIAIVTQLIVFIGDTLFGHEYDYTMLKTEFPSEQPWFETIRVL